MNDEVTRQQIAKFRAAIAEHDGIGRMRMLAEGISPVIIDACKAGLESQLADLERELSEEPVHD